MPLPKATPSFVKGSWTMAKLVVAYVIGSYLIHQATAVSVPIGVAVAAVALSGFFIVGVDCSHRSFFPYAVLNDLVGTLVLLPLLRSVESVRRSPKVRGDSGPSMTFLWTGP